MTDRRFLLLLGLAFGGGLLAGIAAAARAKCAEDAVGGSIVLRESRGSIPAPQEGSLDARDLGDTFVIELGLWSEPLADYVHLTSAEVRESRW